MRTSQTRFYGGMVLLRRGLGDPRVESQKLKKVLEGLICSLSGKV
jgi:hypothetical protein